MNACDCGLFWIDSSRASVILIAEFNVLFVLANLFITPHAMLPSQKMQRNGVAMTFDDRFFLPDEVFEMISKNNKMPQCGKNKVSNCAQLDNVPSLAAVVQNNPQNSFGSTLDVNEYCTDWQQLRRFVDLMTCLNQTNEKLIDITEHESCPDDRTCYNSHSRHDHPNLAPQSLKNLDAPSRRNRTHRYWYLSSSSGVQPLDRQQRVCKIANEKDGAHNDVGGAHPPPENMRSRGKHIKKPATGPQSRRQSSEAANDHPVGLPHSPSHVQNSRLLKPVPPHKERIIGAQNVNSSATIDSPLLSRLSRYDRSLPNSTAYKLQRSASSLSRIQRYSVRTRAKTTFRHARRISKHQHRESITERVPTIFTSTVMPRTQKLKDLIRVERLKNELAKMAIGPDYCADRTHKDDRSRRSNSKHSEKSGNDYPKRSKKELKRYSVDSDAAPRTIRRRRHRRSLSKGLHRSRSLHSSPCRDVMHEHPSGTNRFATNIAEKRRAEMASVGDLWNASMAPYNIRSLHSLKSSTKSTDFISIPPQRICQYFDRVRHIDFDNNSTDYDNVTGSIDRRHYRTLSKTKEDGFYYTKGGRPHRSDRVDRDDRKVDQGLLVEMSNVGRTNTGLKNGEEVNRSLRRIKTDVVREQRFSRSCDHLNIPSLQYTPDNVNHPIHYSGMGTFNYISDCCPDISEFQPPFYTVRPSRLSSADVVERRLRRSATSSLKSFPCSCGCETRMMNLSISKDDNG